MLSCNKNDSEKIMIEIPILRTLGHILPPFIIYYLIYKTTRYIRNGKLEHIGGYEEDMLFSITFTITLLTYSLGLLFYYDLLKLRW